jgi:hypothetical protein
VAVPNTSEHGPSGRLILSVSTRQVRRRSEVVAALANGVIVELLAAGVSAIPTIGRSLGIGASDYSVTVHPPGWTPLTPIAATALQFGLVILPFAGLAVWRTWVHAKRWRDAGTRGWQGVAEAAACGLATLLVLLLPGMLTHPIQVLPYVVGGGWLAVLIGLLVGLLLRTTAVMVLKVTQPTTANIG